MNKIKRAYVKHMTIESKGTYVQSFNGHQWTCPVSPLAITLDVPRLVTTILNASLQKYHV